MIKNNADVIAGGVGVGLIAFGTGYLWAWPAGLIVLGLWFVFLAAAVI